MERYPLYKGHINVDYDPTAHKYFVDEKQVEGITDTLRVINKPWYSNWVLKLSEEYILENLTPGKALDEIEIKDLAKGAKGAYKNSTRATDIGTMFHSWVEAWYRGENPVEPMNEQLRNATNAFLRFTDQHKLISLGEEKVVYSVEHKFAGRYDKKCIFEGKIAILDWKSSENLSAEYLLQMGGYDIADSEEQLFTVDKVEDFEPIELHIIVQCSKAGELNVVVSDQVERNRNGFLYALGLTRTLKVIEEEWKEEKKAAKLLAKSLEED